MAFQYEKNIQYGQDKTQYVNIGKEGVSLADFDGEKVLKVDRSALVKLTEAAFSEVSFRLRPAHTKQVASFKTLKPVIMINLWPYFASKCLCCQ